MQKFFVPKSWDKNVETIQFKSIKGNLSGAQTAKTIESKAQHKKTKKKSKNKKATTPITHGKGPLAPPKLDGKQQKSQQKQSTPKIKTGRIEKKKAKLQQKEQKQKLKLTPALAKAAAETLDESVSVPLNDFQTKLKAQLQGGRFRYINEQLYTMDSQKADALFREDRDAFAAYHAGYRQQVEKWPLNPLKRIIKTIRRLPKALEIGDFGCGEGKLAQSVSNKVYSMDLVSCRDDIIACDMAKTPLQSETLDVAVYCLSLMGTNLCDYLLEANRVLKLGGQLYIVEIQSRFDDVRQFVRGLEACGFELIKKDANVDVFYFFHLKKVRFVGKVALLPEFSLKPCLYRKR